MATQGNNGPRILFILGSKSDRDKVGPALELVNRVGVEYDTAVISAHRDLPELMEMMEIIPTTAVKVVIAVAGMAAALPGIVAAGLKGKGILVIGVPLSSSVHPDGLDALFSITQVPAGLPLVCAGVDAAGVINATLAALEVMVMTGDCEQNLLLEEYSRRKEEKPVVWPDSIPRPNMDEKKGN
ncbi:MAG: AIR carboxylase family protein [Candidatus Buchananbacteria bacterium]